MSIIKFKSFPTIAEGDDQVLRIKACEYKPDFNKIIVTFEDAEGNTRKNNFDMNREKAAAAFEIMAKCAMHDSFINEIDPAALVGRYILSDVVKRESNGNTYINFCNYRQTDETFGDEPGEPASGDSGEFDELFS